MIPPTRLVLLASALLLLAPTVAAASSSTGGFLENHGANVDDDNTDCGVDEQSPRGTTANTEEGGLFVSIGVGRDGDAFLVDAMCAAQHGAEGVCAVTEVVGSDDCVETVREALSHVSPLADAACKALGVNCPTDHLAVLFEAVIDDVGMILTRPAPCATVDPASAVQVDLGCASDMKPSLDLGALPDVPRV